MPSFTLVHGSAQNANGWARVADALRDAGFSVSTPELPKNEPTWSLRDYASFVGRCDIAVGASFAGSLLPLIDCDTRVFCAALIPEPRRSVRDQLAADPTMMPPDWLAVGARWRDDPSEREALARRYLFHDCDEETLEWALTTVDFLNTAPLGAEPSPFDAWPPGRDVVIIPTGDRTISPDWMRRRAAAIRAEVFEIDAGHCPHVSFAEEVAAILSALA